MKTTILRFAAVALLAQFLLIPATAQDAAKPRRVGVMLTSSSSDPVAKRVLEQLSHGLGEHGWEVGRNVLLEVRFSGPDPARFPELAAELVAPKVDAIVAGNSQSTEAARRKTTTIPIVMLNVADPLVSGFVESLTRPGGNITGLVNQMETVVGKLLELLKGVKPGIERVGIIYSPDLPVSDTALRFQQEEMAPRVGLSVLPIPVSKPADFEAAFATIARERPHALHVHPIPLAFAHRKKIAAFAIERRLPTISGSNALTLDGFLISYGPDTVATWRRAAGYVDRILRGANPAELPVEQVERFELVINLKTARELGLTIPASILLRANEVIE